MPKQTLNNSEVRAEQVASTKLKTLKLGLDVHAETIVVVRILDQSSPPPAQKFTPPKFLEWVKKQVGLAEAGHSCYEAGPFGYGLHRQLAALGLHNVVVQPVCLDERHTLTELDARFGKRFREQPETARLDLATVAIEKSVTHARLKEMCSEHPKDLSATLAQLVDQGWEAQAAYELDHNKNVAAWVKNDHLSFEVTYIFEGVFHKFRPDYLIRLGNAVMLILETKGQDTPKDQTKRRYLAEWVRAVNGHGGFGKWTSDVCLNPSDLPTVIHNAAAKSH